MPDDDDDHGDNRTADMKLDAEILKIVGVYAEHDADSGVLSEKRAALRVKAKALGVESYDLQSAVYKLKRMTKAQRVAHERTVARIIKAADGRQAEFWPKDTERNKKRADRAAAKAAKAKESATAQEQRVAADSPRSDPKRGGAGGAKGRGKAKDVAAKKPRGNIHVVSEAGVTTEDVPLVEETGDELIARVARERQADQEQRDGGNVLDSAIDAIKSQSEKSAEALAKAGLA